LHRGEKKRQLGAADRGDEGAENPKSRQIGGKGMSNESTARALIVGPGEGSSVDLGGLGVVFKVWGEATGGALSIAEHPMEPRRLVPPRVHEAEDELSYVLEGTFGVRIGEFEAEAGPGSYYKPKGVLQTFWSPTDSPARS
jgi:mannose-6-phosphate isomerase-like protein (cupin superfamily)